MGVKVDISIINEKLDLLYKLQIATLTKDNDKIGEVILSWGFLNMRTDK